MSSPRFPELRVGLAPFQVRRIIRANGTVEALPPEAAGDSEAIRVLIGARFSTDSVALRHLGSPLVMMIVDDTGHRDGRAFNGDASELYRLNCRPGSDPDPIVGDVAICLDSDFSRR